MLLSHATVGDLFFTVRYRVSRKFDEGTPAEKNQASVFQFRPPRKLCSRVLLLLLLPPSLLLALPREHTAFYKTVFESSELIAAWTHASIERKGRKFVSQSDRANVDERNTAPVKKRRFNALIRHKESERPYRVVKTRRVRPIFFLPTWNR